MRRILTLYRNAYQGISTRVWLLSIVMLINRSGTMVLAFMTLYCKHLGYTLAQGGAVVAIYGAGAVCGGFLGGKLCNAIGFFRVQFAALFLGGIFFIILGLAESYISICIIAFLLALVNESFRPANASAIAHYSTLANRTKAFSLVRLAINLGWGIGVAIGGILASINYSLLFWVDGFTSMSAAFLLLLFFKNVRVNEGRDNPATVEEATLHQSPYRDKTFLHFLIFQLLFAVCFFQLFTTIPVFFRSNLMISEYWIGVIMALNGLMIAVFEMVIVFKLDGRKPYLTLMAYGSILMSASFFLLMLPASMGFLVAGATVLVLTVAEMISMPFMNSYYLARTSNTTRGSYAGMYTMTWSVAQMIGSSSGALIAGKYGFVSLWFSVALLSLVAAAGYFSLQRRSKFLPFKNA